MLVAVLGVVPLAAQSGGTGGSALDGQKKLMVFDISGAPVVAPTPQPATTPTASVQPAKRASKLPLLAQSSETESLTQQPVPRPTAAPAEETNPAPDSEPLDAEPVPGGPPSPVADIVETAKEETSTGTEPLPSGSEPTDVISDAQELNLGTGLEDTSPSESVTINLIRKLVERGILTKEDAQIMIAQAQAEAEVAKAQTQADMFAVAQIAAAQAASEQIAMEQALNAPGGEDVRVTYIPEPVKTQIKEDIKMELIAEGNRQPFKDLNTLPSWLPKWVNRITPYGDLRVRFESDLYPAGNDATGAFPDFDAINTGDPFDVTGNEFAPQWNTDQDRYRFRIRARLGAVVDMTDGFGMGFRIATGNSTDPISTNQTLGSPYGNFSKYAIWIDRAYLTWQLWDSPGRNFQIWAGRFANPFFATDLIWDDDINFDGFAATFQYEIFDDFRPFLTGGAFPVYNTALNFPSNQPSKYKSYDKYLFAAQLGFEWQFADDWTIKLATSYYHFYNIEGKLSSPFVPLSPDDAGDTDNSRPLFAQKGNTYFPIRNIIPDASNDFGATNQWQYYGLATKFQELAVTGRLVYDGFEPIQIALTGEFVANLAWNKGDINAIAVNNRGAIDPNDIDDILGQYEGSPYAFMVGLRVGHAEYLKRWDWNVDFTYRWIGSDAVVDGFNDSDFGLGGTNMQGFTVAGSVALAPNVWIRARWLGSDSIAGPQFNLNIVQIDLNGEF